jgi:CHASE2 domain-containing sensor protein
VPSLVLLASARQLGVPLDQVVVDLSGVNPVVRLGEVREIPIAADGTMVVPARAGLRRGMSSQTRTESGSYDTRHHFTSLTVDELAYTGQKDDEVAKRILADLQSKFTSLKENLVVIGFDRATDRRFTTASGESLSETMLLARAIAAIQSGRFLDRWPLWARMIGVLALVGVATFLFRFPRRKFLPFALLSAFAGLILAVLLFRFTLNWAPPFLLISLFGALVFVGLVIPVKKSDLETVS